MNNRNYRTLNSNVVSNTSNNRARVPVNYQNTELEWYTFLSFE